ncbi:MAG: two-CW domain-containing protein [Nitrospirota bacterium]
MEKDTQKKKNCWEHMKCGRELGGEKAKDLGVCPANLEKKLNGVHDGFMAGRACWVVAGTFCKGKVQGTFVQKLDDCVNCSFYQRVKEEEYPHNKLSLTLLNMLEKP